MEPLNRPLPRRDFLKWSTLAGFSWLTPLGQHLADAAEQKKGAEPAQSVILLWLGGGPSQLETFDPHPGTAIAGGTRAIDTAVKGIQLAEGFDLLAEQMESVAIIRSMVSREGEHERGTYTLKTGYEPDATLVHPSLGAICCHELDAGRSEIPRHISILANQWPGRGGFLGDEYDAFKIGDPALRLPDVTPHVPLPRLDERLKDLQVVEDAFAKGRKGRVEATMHRQTIERARTMMTSDQLKAFDVTRESADLQKAYGDTPFGRGCLAARRLIEVGVRCVEVTLDGFDSHVNNHSIHKKLVKQLDPAFATLIRDLKQRDLLRKTIVVCMGEFGRTPKVNAADGRDHWPHNFAVALAGGGIKGGQAIGQSDPEGGKEVTDKVPVADLHATVLAALGLKPDKENPTKVRRRIKLSEGKPVKSLLG